MKAWILHGIDDIRYEEVNRPTVEPNEVLVKVKAAGICGSDIPRIYATGAHRHPLIPGHEYSGEVVEVGTNVDASWNNKRVGIFPLIPCKECVACQQKKYEMCRDYSYLGSRRDGGFAEYVAVPEWNLIQLPDSVGFEAAAMLEPMSVAIHALRRVHLECEQTIAICGLGTIGMLLLMMLLDYMKEHQISTDYVLLIGNKQFQKKKAMDLGIKENNYCDINAVDVSTWIKEKTGGIGVDIFFECVGKADTIANAVDFAAPAGQICLVGNPYSDLHLEKNVYWKILRNQLVISGTWNSSFNHSSEDDWNYVLRRLESGRLQPEKMISHRFDLEKLEDGFCIMRDKVEDYLKIMTVL